MKLRKPVTLKDLASLVDVEVIGDENHLVTGINEIHMVEKGDLVFVDHPKYYQKALNSNATTILINTKEVEVPTGKALLFSETPFAHYNFLTKHFKPYVPWTDEERPYQVGKSTNIHPGAHIGHDVTIGDNCIIASGVVINDDTVIGDNVIVHANTVLGSDAFYYNKKGGVYNKMHSCGRLVIEDNVEIGAGCTIDKGVSGDTVIGQGSKLDCQVHIGHDTQVGSNCLFAAHVGVAGCVIVEDNVTLWGKVGVRSDVTIGEGAVVLGLSGVTKSIPGGITYFGVPAQNVKQAYREMASVRNLNK